MPARRGKAGGSRRPPGCPGDGHDPRGRVDRDPPDVARDRLDLSGVDAGSDRQAKALRRVADGSRSPNRALSRVKLGQYAVSGGLDESSLMAIDRGRGLAI